jgi:hypothetical protein
LVSTRTAKIVKSVDRPATRVSVGVTTGVSAAIGVSVVVAGAAVHVPKGVVSTGEIGTGVSVGAGAGEVPVEMSRAD